MMYQSYNLSRYIGDDAEHGTSITVADDDPINCAHMLAAGFNTMNRNMLNNFVLAVVDKDAGSVHYDGKVERLVRIDEQTSAVDEWPANLFFSKTFNFEGSTLGESLITFFGENDETTHTVRGDVKADDTPRYAHVERSVLEWAFAELQAVKSVLADAGVETIPADAGVLMLNRRLDHEQHARTAMEEQYGQANESARAEMISFVKRAHAKKVKLQTAVPNGDGRPELDDRWQGMLDVLAKFLVVTGEADASEGHAVARRLCGIDDE